MKYIILLICLLTFVPSSNSQELSSIKIKALIDSYKSDIRGPYYRIKWFCDDGSIRDPKDPCPDDIGGIQHASFKQNAIDLRKSNHLFFGEILAAVEYEDFLDAPNHYDRLKQYQLNKYLASVDDGWVLRKGQFYRGAVQSEDEEAWGKEFFLWLLEDDDFITSNYYLLRQALKDIPHSGDSNLAQQIRSLSKTLADEYEPFMDLRIKIHGKPQPIDLGAVEKFYASHQSKLNREQKQDFEKLIETMKAYYAPLDFEVLKPDVKTLNPEVELTQRLETFVNTNTNTIDDQKLITQISEVLDDIRLDILKYKSPKDRLTVLDLSNQLENFVLSYIQEWETADLKDLLSKIETLACISKGTGLIEIWEYNAIDTKIQNIDSEDDISIEKLISILETSRSIVEWSASMVKANYQETVDNYTEFEPLAYGFIDDKVRSSIALSLGDSVSELSSFVAEITNMRNDVMSLDGQGDIRGLNPGFAMGELIVVEGNPDKVVVDTDKIYIFQRPPSDLKPVAGIMTVSEGNLVSHVQLLARNLGIPNAALSATNLKDLLPFHGKKVFYAVSSKGNVILKLENEMSENERTLFTKKQQRKTVVEVPTDQIDLNQKTIVNMREVDASDSGKLCGPKAANLGELKKNFPNHVVEGIIIPFGIFREHMNQAMPNENKTYWQFLNDTFNEAEQMREEGKSENAIENYQLRGLEKLHNAIINIDLSDSFLSDIERSFRKSFGNSIGQVPVFLRSDTNMEDLKEFTGAGLNLTLFNIVDKDAILNGIKRVWASAYTERSFKWRQKFLSNPENVFPSILIIPSVDVDYSGVMITKGINAGNDNDLTVAFSRGAGGAVDGQSAETRLITESSDFLLVPARQSDYIRLPSSGGTKDYRATFQEPILNSKNINEIRNLAKEIRKKIPKNEDERKQAYDVEFGFKDDKLWLFQIRPFVENKNAKSSEYLNSISPKINLDKKVNLSTSLRS